MWASLKLLTFLREKPKKVYGYRSQTSQNNIASANCMVSKNVAISEPFFTDHKFITPRWAKYCCFFESWTNPSTQCQQHYHKRICCLCTVQRWSDARPAGWVQWWQETIKGSKRFNSMEWRICFAHLGLNNLCHRYSCRLCFSLLGCGSCLIIFSIVIPSGPGANHTQGFVRRLDRRKYILDS